MKLFRGRLVLIDQKLQTACILVEGGKVKTIFNELYPPELEGISVEEVVDAGNFVLMPGVVDSHVHVNEPGRTAWEGFETATSAAATGGITTIVDMPLNSIPPTTSMENFRTKLKSAEGKCHVDVGFWGGVVPGNTQELRGMIKMGVAGFKCFLVNSGVDEFQHVSKEQVLEALKEMEGTGSVLLFHAEFDLCGGGDEENEKEDIKKNPVKYETFLKSRPSQMENDAISFVINACHQTMVRCHIVHLGSGEAVPMIRRAKQAGVPLTVETCHHYLSWTSEEISDGATQFKCCPPIREKIHQEALWIALKEGLIDLVVSDHSPCTPDLKQLEVGDFLSAWGGISSVQYGLSLFWTNCHRRGLTIPDLSRFLMEGPAKLAGLDKRKGKISEGYDADFVIWDPYEEFVVKTNDIRHKNKVTPYTDVRLLGKVKRTVVRGETVFNSSNVQCLRKVPCGTFLLI